MSSVFDLEEATSKLQKKLGELHLPQRQHVIIPNHIHVPESERTKLSFGSFDASFGVASNYASAPESEKSSTPVSESSQVVEETVEEQAARFVTWNFWLGFDVKSLPSTLLSRLLNVGRITFWCLPSF